MRISDLSRQTGVPIATIKFYLRERLLPPGTPTGRNQAAYGEAHLRRLRLIRALTNIGQLELTSVRELLTAIENDKVPLPALYALVDRALFPQEPALHSVEGAKQVRADVDRFVKELGWSPDMDAPSRDRLALVVLTLQRLGCECGMEYFLPYAEAAEKLAVQDLDLLPADGVGADRAAVVVRGVLLDVALSALRRMAQEHHATLRFGATKADVRHA
ncbi:MerR family transcriptional regulator [Micromonospora schwarzwaldensis]|uniref:MerR family transcriptional regulator n=1 Tax=Micromonospora sp. DSM 45708 TaxID=3111767 RepID=UPI0031D09FF5